jgi:hypothetical protein
MIEGGTSPPDPPRFAFACPVGGCAVGGTMLQPDAAGTISVPPDLVNALLAAGYTRLDAGCAVVLTET